jgi:hypothetical protein
MKQLRMFKTIPAHGLCVCVLLAGVAGFGWLRSGPARADEPRRIEDCEKIQAADAYNQCLAKFGPTSKLKNLEPEKPSDVKASPADAAATSKPSRYRGHRHGTRRRRHR